MNKFNKGLLVFLFFLFIINLFILLGCTQSLKTPPGFKIDVREKTLKRPYGLCNLKEKQIIISPPKWIPEYITIDALINHELGHAWGIKKCDRCQCLMYENKLGYVEYYVKPLQLLYGLKFCPDCIEYLKNKNAIIE